MKNFYYGSSFYKKVATRMINLKQSFRLEDLLKIFLDVRSQEGGGDLKNNISKAQTYKLLSVLKESVCFDGVNRWSKKTRVFKNDHGVEKKGTVYKIIPFDKNMMLKSIDDYFNNIGKGSNHREEQIKALKKELGLNKKKETKKEEKPTNTGYHHFLIGRLRELYAEDYRKQEEYAKRDLPVPEEIRDKIYNDRKELEVAYPQDNIPGLDDFVVWLKIALCAKYLNRYGNKIGKTILKRRGINQEAYKAGLTRFEKFDLGISATMSEKSIVFPNLEEALGKIKSNLSLFYGIEGEKLNELVNQCTPDKKDWVSERQKLAYKKWYDEHYGKSEPQRKSTNTTTANKKVVKVEKVSAQIRDYVIRITAGLIKKSSKSVKISDLADIFENSGLSIALGKDQLKKVLSNSLFEVKDNNTVELKAGVVLEDVKKKYTGEITFVFATVFDDFHACPWMKSVEQVVMKGETKIFRITCDNNVKSIVNLASWYSGLKPEYEVIVDKNLVEVLKKISGYYKIESVLGLGNRDDKRLQNDMMLYSIDD